MNHININHGVLPTHLAPTPELWGGGREFLVLKHFFEGVAVFFVLRGWKGPYGVLAKKKSVAKYTS